MKKSLVLAMAMALGVTASAYAANPFSDVPAGHWAYDSINKLAAEFADELDNLGVRVANLEKKADNVKVTGEMRYHYVDHDATVDGKAVGYATQLRSRIWVNGQINDDWKYTGMLENIQDLKNDKGDETTKFQRAYVNGKLGGLAVQAGRYHAKWSEGNVYDNRFDGVQVAYGKDVKLTAGYGKAAHTTGLETPAKAANAKDTYYAELSGKVENLSLVAGYYKFEDVKEKAGVDDKIWTVAANYAFDKNFKLGAMYLNGDKDGYKGDDDGFVVTASYKGAKAAKAGSWGLVAKYYDQGASTYIDHTMNGLADNKLFTGDEGFKGYSVAANYTFAKNIVGQVEYYDLDQKEGNKDAQTLWSQVVFTF